MSEIDRDDLTTRIARGTAVPPEKVGEVVQMALEELHRIAIVDDKGPTAAAMAACFAFGAETAFHLMGLFASEHDYHGRQDEAGMWSEISARLIPQAYREGCDRIAPWLMERTEARSRLNKEILNRPKRQALDLSISPPKSAP